MKQLTVFVANRRGGLAEITRLLAGSRIDMKALSIADTRDFGILRLIVDDAETAAEVLKQADLLVQITEVVGVRLTDEPGALSGALEALDKEEINVEYLYAFLSSEPGSAAVALRVEDNAHAAAVLSAAGYTLL